MSDLEARLTNATEPETIDDDSRFDSIPGAPRDSIRREIARRVGRKLAVHHKRFLGACADSKPPRMDLALRYAAALPPDTRLYASALSVLARARDFETATKVFGLYRDAGFAPDVFAYSGIISAAGKAGNASAARDHLANAVADLGDACDVGVYNAYIDACARDGDVREAFATCRAMQSRQSRTCAPNARTYNSLITAAARARDFPAAKAALSELEAVFESEGDPEMEPTDRTFGAVLAAAATCESATENVRWALETYDRCITLKGMALNNHAASSLLTVLARGVAAGAWPAEDAVRRAGEITNALVSSLSRNDAQTGSKHAPNAAVWSAHMSVCARAGRARDALDALALMRACGASLDAYTLASALTACRGVAERRRKDGAEVPSDAAEDADSPESVIATHASPEALEALAAFEKAPASASGSVAVQNAAIALYASAGRPDRAFALYESMREGSASRASTDAPSTLATDTERVPDTITYNTLIAACASSDFPSRAMELHRDMLEAGVPRSGRTYVGLMTAAARAAGPREGAAAAAAVFAMALADETAEPANAFTYTALIDAQVKGRDPEAAFETFEKMKDAGVAPTVVTFGCLLNACRAAGAAGARDDEDASRGAGEVKRRDAEEDAQRNVARAYDLFSQMSSHGVCPNDRCQNALVRVVSEAGRVDDALDRVKKIARSGGRFERATLEGVVLALCRENYPERASRIVGWMAIRGFVPRAGTYGALVRAFCREGSVTAAWKVHEDARNAGDSDVARRGVFGISRAGYRPDRASCSALIVALCRAAISCDSGEARVMTRRAVDVFRTAEREGVAKEGDVSVSDAASDEHEPEFHSERVAAVQPLGQFCPVSLPAASREGAGVPPPPPRGVTAADQILTPAAARALVSAAARCGDSTFAMAFYRGDAGKRALRLSVPNGVSDASTRDGYSADARDDRRVCFESLIESCCHEGDVDGALEVFDHLKSLDGKSRVAVGKVTLAFLENVCRRSRVPEWRVFDVCAQMRAQTQRKKERSLPSAGTKRTSHHVFGSVEDELWFFEERNQTEEGR